MDAESADEARERAVTELWEELSSSLLSWFTRQTGDAHEAEDLLQESFLSVHAHLDELREQETLAAWMRGIARNRLIDWRRRRKLPVEPIDEQESERRGSDAPGMDALVASWLTPAIEELSESDGDVLRLTELEGLTQREAAERLDLSLSAVKSRVLRGRARLRERILACCRLEFDRRGGILDYRKRADDCCDG